MSDGNKNKLINGSVNLFKYSENQFPQPSRGQEDKFSNKLGQLIAEQNESEGMSLKQPIPALVLKVEEKAIPTLGGFRDKTNMYSQTPQKTCLKIWCHTYFDSALSIPKNLITPGKQVGLIYEHFTYEALNSELDLVVPKAGDFVNVTHPYAYGYKNKVGVYLGPLVKAIPNAFSPASANFVKPSKRRKYIPETLRKLQCESPKATTRNPTSSPTINQKIASLHPKFRSKATAFFNKAEDMGYQVDMVYGFRSVELQNNLYAQGRTFSGPKDTKGRIVNRSAVCTFSRGGSSYHNYGLAFDFKILGYKTCKKKASVANLGVRARWEGGMEELGKMGESLGLTWGGRWTKMKDRPHFQYRGTSWKTCRSKLEKGDVFLDAESNQTFVNV